MAEGLRHILVPMDFSPASTTALERGKMLAERFAARLSLLHVMTDPQARGTWTAEIHVPAIPEVRDRLQVSVDAKAGAVAEQILEVARTHHIDLIVMGTHGRRGLAHLVMGSIAERVVREAPCAVMTTHAAHAGTGAATEAQPVAPIATAG